MDPVTLVVAALAGGAAKGVGETATAAVRDAYGSLKRMLAERFASDPVQTMVLSEHEGDPVAWRDPLHNAVADSGAAADHLIVEVAERLLALLDAPNPPSVMIKDSQGVQVGNNNQQHNTFTATAHPER
jgi:hypothetical protein